MIDNFTNDIFNYSHNRVLIKKSTAIKFEKIRRKNETIDDLLQFLMYHYERCSRNHKYQKENVIRVYGKTAKQFFKAKPPITTSDKFLKTLLDFYSNTSKNMDEWIK